MIFSRMQYVMLIIEIESLLGRCSVEDIIMFGFGRVPSIALGLMLLFPEVKIEYEWM